MSSILTALAQPSDLEELSALLQAVLIQLRTQGNGQWDAEYPSREDIVQDLAHETLYVIRRTQQIVAAITIDQNTPQEYSQLSWNNPPPVVSFHRLMVHPAFQGQGLAKALLHFAETIAQRDHASSIRLDAFAENEAANHLYQVLGYREVGKLAFRTGTFCCYEKSAI